MTGNTYVLFFVAISTELLRNFLLLNMNLKLKTIFNLINNISVDQDLFVQGVCTVYMDDLPLYNSLS